MAVTAKNPRNLGIDLMRATAMFFVIGQHFLEQGGLLSYAEGGNYYFLTFLQILFRCAVDAYGITTGYLMCDRSFRLSRVTKLWLTTVFWSVAVSCCFFAFVPASRSMEEMVSMFLPIIRGRYWFFTAYFVTMLVSPALNVVIRTLSKGQYKLLLGALFLIFGVVPVCALGNDVMRIYGGNHFVWMIALYLIGGYLRRFAGEKKADRYLLGYFIFALAHLGYILATHAMGMRSLGGLFITNVSPLIVGEAVCLFLYCRSAGARIRTEGLCGRLIRFVTPGIYAVYVIHVHPKVFWSEEIIALFRPWDGRNVIWVLAAMVGVAAAVFVLCVLLDTVRQWLFRVLGIDRAADRLSDMAEKKIRKLMSEER